MLQTGYVGHGAPRWKRHAANALAVAFDIGIRRVYPVEVRGLERFSGAPSTLVVSNHRRDSDGPIIASVLLQRRLLHIRGVRPCFVAREDLFQRGFLGHYLEWWPLPLRAALSSLNLQSFLTLMGAFPMRRVPERSLWEVLREVLEVFGDLPLDDVLKPSWVVKFQRLSGSGMRPLRVGEVLTWRCHKLLYQRQGLGKLTRSCFRALLTHERTVIESQLQHFSRLLERGETLVLEPEGVVSIDGRFARLRAGLHALLNRPRTAPRVLPVGITYDSMTNDRERIFVNVGPEMLDLRGLSRRETDERVAAAIRAQFTVTCSQLASRFLFMMGRGGEGVVTDSDLEAYVSQEADRYVREGYHVDPRLLTTAPRRRRLRGYVTSCLRQRILLRYGRGRYHIAKTFDRGDARMFPPNGMLRYMNNELSTSALAPLRPGVTGRALP